MEAVKSDNVANISEGVLISVSELSRELEVTRETVNKRLRESDIQPAGTRKGYPAYRLRDAVRACVAEIAEKSEVVPPELLPPRARKDFYMSEDFRIKTELAKKNLVHVEDVRAEMARLVKPIVHTLDIIPDILERDCYIPTAAVEKVIPRLDALRDDLAQELENDSGNDEILDGVGGTGDDRIFPL